MGNNQRTFKLLIVAIVAMKFFQTLKWVSGKEDIRRMERTLSMNYPVIRQNKRVLLNTFVKNHCLKSPHCTLESSPSFLYTPWFQGDQKVQTPRLSIKLPTTL